MTEERDILKKFYIPQPCHEDWDKMSANDQGKFCQSCKETVHDFTGSLTDEKKLLLKKSGSVCGRFYMDEINQGSTFLVRTKPGILSRVRSTVSSAFIFLLFKVGTLTEVSAQDTRSKMELMSMVNREDVVGSEKRTITGTIVNQHGGKVYNFNFSICDSKGRIIQSGKTDFGGSFSLNFDSLEEEIYIMSERVKVKGWRYNTTYKAFKQRLEKESSNEVVVEVKNRKRISSLFRRHTIMGKMRM